MYTQTTEKQITAEREWFQDALDPAPFYEENNNEDSNNELSFEDEDYNTYIGEMFFEGE